MDIYEGVRRGIYKIDLSQITHEQIEKTIQVYLYVYDILLYNEYSIIFVNDLYKNCGEGLGSLTDVEKSYFRLWKKITKRGFSGNHTIDCGGPNCHIR